MRKKLTLEDKKAISKWESTHGKATPEMIEVVREEKGYFSTGKTGYDFFDDYIGSILDRESLL